MFWKQKRSELILCETDVIYDGNISSEYSIPSESPSQTLVGLPMRFPYLRRLSNVSPFVREISDGDISFKSGYRLIIVFLSLITVLLRFCKENRCNGRSPLIIPARRIHSETWNSKFPRCDEEWGTTPNTIQGDDLFIVVIGFFGCWSSLVLSFL